MLSSLASLPLCTLILSGQCARERRERLDVTWVTRIFGPARGTHWAFAGPTLALYLLPPPAASAPARRNAAVTCMLYTTLLYDFL